MRHAKDPTAKVSAGFPQSQVAEERKEYFLSDLFPLLHGQPKRDRVTEKRTPKLLEQTDDLAFDIGRSGRKRIPRLRGESPVADQISRKNRHRTSNVGIPFNPLLFRL